MKRNISKLLSVLLLVAVLLGVCPLTGLAAEPVPADTAAPEVTTAPETTPEPEQTAEPETKSEPEQTPEPAVTETDETAADPVTTDAPVVTEAPGTTETAVAPEAPTATAEPAVTGAPAGTEAPGVTETDVTPGEPEATDEPAVVAAALDPVARITVGGESRDYATIDEAWAAAVEAGTATVTLLADVTAQSALTVPAGADITFAGGENTLSTACIRVDGGALTVASGTVQDAGDDSPGDTCAVRIRTGSLTVNGGAVRGLNIGVDGSGGDVTVNGGAIYGAIGVDFIIGDVTVNGGEITGDRCGVVIIGDMTVTGGSVTGGIGVALSSGKLTVTGGSITGTEACGLLLAEDTTASLSGGTYAGVGRAVSCGGEVLGSTFASNLTLDDLLAYGYGWYGADGALLTPAADATSLAGPVTVGPLPVAPATPVLKVTGENVLLSSDPTDIGQEYDAPLTDGAQIEGGNGRIVVPAEYVVQFPDAGVKITEQRYNYNTSEMPDTPIYHRYVFKITDPTLTELNVTVSPNPDTPTWTKVISHTYADFRWALTDCAGYSHDAFRAQDEWIFYAAEDSGGVILDLSRAKDVEPKPIMKTGTAEDAGDRTYILHSENGVIEFTMAPGSIPVHFTGETDGLVKASEYVVNRRGENYVQVYVKPGYAVVPGDENTAVSAEVTIDENDDGSDMLHYMLDAEAAAENGVESVTVRVEKLNSATLSVNEPEALLAADPYGSDRGPILTDGDAIPLGGGWLLTKSGRWYSDDNYECALQWRAAAYGKPGSEIYNWTYIYPLKDGEVHVTLGPDEAPAHWTEVTVNNPGQRNLFMYAYADDQEARFDSDPYSAPMILSDYLFVESADGSPLDRDDITDTVGIQGVTKYYGYGTELLRLTVDPTAEKISFTVKAPAGSETPTDTPKPTDTAAPTDTPKPTDTAAPTATPGPTATPEPTATPVPTATPAPTVTPVPTATAAPMAVPTATPTAAAGATAAPGAASPETGDETALAPWALMLLGCGVALTALVLYRRRERR